MSASQDHILILAAGRGTRAGGPKALIQVAGKPWWQTQAVRLAATRLPTTWVVSERVRAEIGTKSKLSMVTADESAPMFTSVLAGAKHIDTAKANPRGLFILPVDVPTPNPTTFEKLAAACKPPREGAVPEHEETNGHPIYLRWPFVESILLKNPHTPDTRLDHLTEDLLTVVPVTDPNVTANLNTAADFAKWAKLNPDG